MTQMESKEMDLVVERHEQVSVGSRSWRWFRRWIGSPWLNVVFLVVGLFVASWVAWGMKDEYYIADGCELALLSLGRMLLQRRTRWFFWGLFGTALYLPAMALITGPIFYSGRSIWQIPWEETALVALLPMVVLLAFSSWGLWGKGVSRENDDPTWFRWIDRLFELSLALIVLTLGIGEWNNFTIVIVVFGAVCFAVGMVLVLMVRLRLTRRGVGNLVVGLGAVVCLCCLILIATQGGRVDVEEAAVGFIPGAVLVGVGLVICASSFVKRTSTSVGTDDS